MPQVLAIELNLNLQYFFKTHIVC